MEPLYHTESYSEPFNSIIKKVNEIVATLNSGTQSTDTQQLKAEICPDCNGEGVFNFDSMIEHSCRTCNGTGKHPNNKQSTPCQDSDTCPVHRCKECSRYYDDMYQLT